jgi:hypothetical protein
VNSIGNIQVQEAQQVRKMHVFVRFTAPLIAVLVVICLISDRMLQQLVAAPVGQSGITAYFGGDVVPLEATAHAEALPKTPTTTGGSK